MKALFFTPRAAADIDAIWDYSAEVWGLDQADRYTDDIRDACRALAAGQKQGRATAVRPGYFSYVTGSHVIWFRGRDGGLEIVRILHGQQDPGRHLSL